MSRYDWIKKDNLVISEHMSGYGIVLEAPYLSSTGVWKVKTSKGIQPCSELLDASFKHLRAYREIQNNLTLPDEELGKLIKKLLKG